MALPMNPDAPATTAVRAAPVTALSLGAGPPATAQHVPHGRHGHAEAREVDAGEPAGAQYPDEPDEPRHGEHGERDAEVLERIARRPGRSDDLEHEPHEEHADDGRGEAPDVDVA